MRETNDANWRYISATFAPEDDELRAIREVGERLVPGMQVSAAEGKMLQLLLRMINAKRVLEIGTFIGYSTVCMARALADDGEIITCEFKAEHADIAAQHCADYPVTIMQGDALVMINSWAEAPYPNPLPKGEGSARYAHANGGQEQPSPRGEGEPKARVRGEQQESFLFDAVFIDAEKRRYVDYLDAVLPLLRPGGLILADNTLLFGAMAGTPLRDNISQEAIAAMQQFNRRLADPHHFTGMMIPTPEGLTVGVKR